ncbi:MAG: xanthine phosphoribosyltransferase, partial [Anaerolineae bacterium]|nr:xanthine phosphoribosyltransferase [Anaerolineae bacterium]
MEELERRILAEGKNLGRGILKVDSFINHQIDTHLMFEIGRELARHFAGAGVTKVLTAEISGIAPALATAHALDVPVIYARKIRPIT